MGSKFIDSMITTAVGFVFFLITNAVTSYFIVSQGEIYLDKTLDISGSRYDLIEIVNFSNKTINNLYINFPSTIALENITASQPVIIKVRSELKNSATQQQVTISNIAPMQKLSLIYPHTTNKVVVVNADEHKLELKSDLKIVHPIKEGFKKIILNASIYALFLGILQFFIVKQKDKITSQIADLKKDISDLNLNNENLRKESNKTYKELMNDTQALREKHIKAQILYSARISDYAKELRFWRDTIRKILMQSKHDPEAVIYSITETLKTYGTLGRHQNDFETIEVMAKILNQKT